MIDLQFNMEARKLRETWQARVLAASKGVTARVVMAVLIAEYPTVVPTLLKALGIPDDALLPALVGYAQIVPSGRVVCEMIDRDRSRKTVSVYDNEEKLKYDFRKLADKLKLADLERGHLFQLIQKWVAADMRVNHEGARLH